MVTISAVHLGRAAVPFICFPAVRAMLETSRHKLAQDRSSGVMSNPVSLPFALSLIFRAGQLVMRDVAFARCKCEASLSVAAKLTLVPSPGAKHTIRIPTSHALKLAQVRSAQISREGTCHR